MGELHQIGTLWIGERLSFLEQLCLKSFVDHGHEVTLFSYNPIANVPSGVRTRDAREIVDLSQSISASSSKSAAILADIFRVRMVRHTDLVWVDCDVCCLRPFPKQESYVLGYETSRKVSNSVLGAPSDSEALSIVDDHLSNEGLAPPWWSEKHRNDHLSQFGDFKFIDMKWGTTGPHALTWSLRQTGEIRFAADIPVFHLLASKRRRFILRRTKKVQEAIGSEVRSLHFYGTTTRRLLTMYEVPKNSFLASLASKHEISVPESPDLFAKTL